MDLKSCFNKKSFSVKLTEFWKTIVTIFTRQLILILRMNNLISKYMSIINGKFVEKQKKI